MKTCSKCGVEKALDEFSRATKEKSGRRSRCKACVREGRAANINAERERSARYRATHREKVLEGKRRYRTANAEKVRAGQRDHYRRNRDAVLAKNRVYVEAHAADVAAYKRQWEAENRERNRERKRAYYEANRDRLLKTGRRAVDPLSRNGFVYRLFDADDRLLYVGLTYNVENRLFNDPRNHAETKPWFGDIAFVWVEEFETYADAQEEERHAYATEAPLYNKAPLYPTTERPSPVAASEFDLETRQMVDL